MGWRWSDQKCWVVVELLAAPPEELRVYTGFLSERGARLWAAATLVEGSYKVVQTRATSQPGVTHPGKVRRSSRL